MLRGVASWPEPVERVTSFLGEAGAEVRVEEFPEGTRTAQDAADAVGCKLGQIVKSLLFECDGRPVLAMVPGDRKADTAKIATAAGASSAQVASADRVRELTGVDPGAVSPVPPPPVDRVLIDPRLLLPDSVWIGAGSPKHVACLSPAELVRLSGAEQLDLVSDP
jgi:prolyl-tRNA editing enzyme YbaK/EbsC (Cys-tRNA(Pro) deacylase)